MDARAPARSVAVKAALILIIAIMTAALCATALGESARARGDAVPEQGATI